MWIIFFEFYIFYSIFFFNFKKLKGWSRICYLIFFPLQVGCELAYVKTHFGLNLGVPKWHFFTKIVPNPHRTQHEHTSTSAERGLFGTSACASAQGQGHSWHELRVTNNIFCDKHQNLCENGMDTRVLGVVKSGVHDFLKDLQQGLEKLKIMDPWAAGPCGRVKSLRSFFEKYIFAWFHFVFGGGGRRPGVDRSMIPYHNNIILW